MQGKLTVTVTPEDIANGVREDCFRCPVALAVARTLGAAAVVVSAATIRVQMTQDGIRDHYYCPMSVDAFVGDYDDPDNWLPPKPFTFETWNLEEEE
jgi:hypothetical protein